MTRVTFVTGARSEYGLAKTLLRELDADPRFSLEIVVNGMHLLAKFGYTICEIEADGFQIVERLETYSESGSDKLSDFVASVEQIGAALERRRPDAVLVIGDRIEAYAAALAAHFKGIRVIHSGGGNLTLGAVDDIYRYNISNLSQLHLTTSHSAYERLRASSIIDAGAVHFTGSIAVDSIFSFISRPRSIGEFVPELQGREFALMTFHSVTAKDEPTADVMQASIDAILARGSGVLITYPNNDTGFEAIIDVIRKNSERPGVFVSMSLGAVGYYSALQACSFVIGNSSSGVVEAPYFGKCVVNVGSRQEGRDRDEGVRDVPAEVGAVMRVIEDGYREGWPIAQCHGLYGDGHSVARALEVIGDFLGKTAAG